MLFDAFTAFHKRGPGFNFSKEDLEMDLGQEFAAAYYTEHGGRRNCSEVNVPRPQ